MCNYTFNETPYIRVNVSLDNLMNEQIINIENISDNDITEIKGNINFLIIIVELIQSDLMILI